MYLGTDAGLNVKLSFYQTLSRLMRKQIDARYLTDKVLSDPPLSVYDFGREQPCAADWNLWVQLWQEFTYPGFVLVTSLGPWVCSSHHQNKWYYQADADTLFRRTAGRGNYYGQIQGG